MQPVKEFDQVTVEPKKEYTVQERIDALHRAGESMDRLEAIRKRAEERREALVKLLDLPRCIVHNT